MLSNCQDCKYYHPEACGVNPSYRDMAAALRLKLTAPELEYFSNDLSCCPDWERSPDLELLTHELTLTCEQWRVLAEAILRQGLAEALPEELRPAAEPSGEIVMIAVESSNIEAIGWRAGICQVDFCNGTRYQYSDVPEWIFQDFLESDSKGRFLNRVFKAEYEFDYEQID